MKKIWSKVEIIAIILGIFSAILGFYIFNYPDKAKLYYTIISDELVVSSPTSRIKIYHDSISVPNIKILKVAFWNEGNGYLDREKIITPYFVKLSNDEAKILQTDTDKKSRSDLGLNITSNKLRNSIYISLNGEEVLESNDGFVLKIYYTSNSNKEWIVKTRIIGIPEGFSKYLFSAERNLSFLSPFNPFTKILFFIFSLLLFFSAYYNIKSNISYFSKNRIKDDLNNSILYIFIAISQNIILAVTIYYGYRILTQSLMFSNFLINVIAE